MGSLVGAIEDELGYFEPYREESIVRKASRVVATLAVQRASADGLSEARSRQLRADLEALVDTRGGDGGWGWCASCRSNIGVTASVLIAVSEASDAGHAVHVRGIPWWWIRDYVRRETDVERPADPNRSRRPGGASELLESLDRRVDGLQAPGEER